MTGDKLGKNSFFVSMTSHEIKHDFERIQTAKNRHKEMPQVMMGKNEVAARSWGKCG